MNNLSVELKEISIKGENWKLFVQTSLKDYYISDKGRFAAICPVNFKRKKRHYSIRIIAPYQNSKGYNIIRTTENENTKYYQLHRVVLTTFSPIEGMDNLQVNHKDGNKSNNELSNLEWCTCKENIEHALKNDLFGNIKRVYQYDLDGNFMKEFKSIAQAEKETFILKVNIIACCRSKVRQSGGYQWRYYKQDNIGKVRAKKIAGDLKTRNCKRVAAFQDGIEVRSFNSVLEASEFIGKPCANVNISACALGKRKTAYGYSWQYI